MEMGAVSNLAQETILLNLESPFPDDFLLQIFISESIINGPNTSQKLLPPLPGRQAIKKSEQKSAIYCAKGEEALLKNKNNEALTAFNHALVLAPESSKKIADYYIKRSIVLQKLKAYSESLQDITRALELSNTEKKINNLLKRKKIIESLLSINKLQELNLEDNSKDDILTHGENKELPGVSSALALVHNKEFGRHYVATRDIEVGNVLMIQKPLVFIPIQESTFEDPGGKKWICDYCLDSTIAPIPCNGCTISLYCSRKCQSDAYTKFHKTECKIIQREPPLGSQTSLYLRALLVITKQGENFKEMVTVLDQIKKSKDKRTIGFKDGKFDGCTGNAVLSLLTHNDKQSLLAIVANASRVSVALKRYTDFLKKDSNTILFQLAQFFVYLSYACHMNLYFTRRNNFLKAIAMSLYPVFNLLNHSCACNTLIYDDKQGNKILRACRNIKKGEQIFVTYNSFDVMNLTTEQRQEMLLKSKFFICKCDACQNKYTYKLELKRALEVPTYLKRKLRNKPNDIESLWCLLKLIRKECEGPSLEAKTIELALVNAYLGSANEDLCFKLRVLRIL